MIVYTEYIRIYTGAFRTSPVESLYTEVCDLPLEVRRNELGLRFLYRLRSNTAYIESLGDRENQNYEENEGTTKPMRVHIGKLEQGFFWQSQGGMNSRNICGTRNRVAAKPTKPPVFKLQSRTQEKQESINSEKRL